MIILTWFLLGVLVGVSFVAIVMVTHAIYFEDSELNEKIEAIRQLRLELEKSKTRAAFMKTFERHRQEMEEIVK